MTLVNGLGYGSSLQFAIARADHYLVGFHSLAGSNQYRYLGNQQQFFFSQSRFITEMSSLSCKPYSSDNEL